MAISLYDVTVPVFIRSLTNLASFLRKAGYPAAYKGYPAAAARGALQRFRLCFVLYLTQLLFSHYDGL